VEVQLNGARIHYRRSGSGFPVVLLHAGVADSRMWEPQLAGLGDQFDIIAPDMRGFGKSELPAGPWSPTADLLALMDALAVREAPHIVGCSIGGGVAIDFALEHPDRVSKLVLVGATVIGLNLGEENDPIEADVRAAEETGDLNAVNEAEMRLWLVGPGRAPDRVDEKLRELFLDMNGIALRSDFESAPRRPLLPQAPRRMGEIKAPTLVVVGDHDLPDIHKHAAALMRGIPGARKAVIHDAAHLPSLEHPEEFNALLLNFLNG
jgi:pimeloyl-ACP methyl ester carboxylesterase